MPAPDLNLDMAWPAGEAGGSRRVKPTQALDPPDKSLSCYEVAQAWASNDIYGGTFGRIEGARNLRSIIDSQYARNRQWAQFGACTNASH